jgi:micrococcal nuclease
MLALLGMKPTKYALLVYVLCACMVKVPAQTLVGRAVKIADGDTFTLLTSQQTQVKIRLAEIDAPEKGQPFATQAKQALAALCFGKTVKVSFTKKDRYQRVIGYVFTSDGQNINEWMVENGFAWQFEKYSSSTRLQQLQAQAKQHRKALWSQPNPTPPWLWRSQQRKGR